MSKTVLCVDDSATMQTVCEITFRASDYAYVGAKSADEGLQKAKADKPAIVLVDAGMPGASGYELCQKIKADGGLAGVPVVLMCGNSSPYDAAKGDSAGADGHVVKPWDSTKMLEQVHEFVATGAKPAVGAAMPAPAPIPKAPVAAAPAPAPAPIRAPSAPVISSPRPVTPAAAPPPARPVITAPAMPRPATAPPVRPAVTASAPRPVAAPAPIDRPPMIKGTPTRRPAVPGPAAASARSATLMGIPKLQMPGQTNKPPGVTSISSKHPVQAEMAERIADAIPAAAAAAAQEAGLTPGGPEMQALVKLSTEVIERIAWEIVPDLAEAIIRENLERLTANK